MTACSVRLFVKNGLAHPAADFCLPTPQNSQTSSLHRHRAYREWTSPKVTDRQHAPVLTLPEWSPLSGSSHAS
ncbi:hypothetical protein [Acetobacter sp.]|uniref:hypothetical protein n=1 Tax=Acetobacter sp. TaxID=440 RepID=UPI00258B5DC7|nr:hypothetical protein [Acetobacter sp.]MCC6103953.1 hypothetical protein [Acetobacter sp.]